MSSDRDLFGKMNALFEKRAPDALQDKGLDHGDFPVLTEVVGDEAEPAAPPPVMESRQDVAMPPPPPAPAAAQLLDDETVEKLAGLLEQRFADLFIRQQARIEETVRRVIREELARPRKHL